MGWFDRKKLLTASAILPMVEDTPDILKQSVTNSILSNTDIVPDILDTLNNCLATNVGRYWRYGRDKYTNGLPEGDIGFERVPADRVQKALDGDYPPPADHVNAVLSAAMDELDTDRYAYEMLGQNIPDFNPETLTWTYIDEFGTARDATYLGATVEDVNTLRVNGSYQRYISGGELVTKYFHYLYTTPYELHPNQLYYMVQYVVIDTAGTQSKGMYYNYWINSNKYPDMTPDYSEKYSLFMPVIPLRINNVSYTSEDKRDTPLYKTSKSMLDIIDIDITKLDEGINANPEIKDIDHAYFVLGINPAQDKEQVNQYLFLFFNDLAAKSGINRAEFYRWFNSRDKINQPPINVLTIKDNTYYTALAWNFIDTDLIEGSIGKEGTVVKIIDAKHGTMNVSLGSGEIFNRTVITIENPNNLLILKKQVSPTHYQQLTVSGLMFSNRIYGPDKDYVTTLAADKDGDEVLLPLNLSIIQDMPKLDANHLFYYSYQMVFNAYEWKKLKWYQTGFFKIVTAVIAIAITVFYPPAGSLIGSIITAASAGVIALVTVLAEIILTSIVVQIGFKFAAEHLGLEFAAILAAVMMVYGLTGSDSMFGLPFASDILNIATIGFDTVQTVIGEELIGVQTDMAEFAEEAEDKMKELEDLTAELNPQVTLDPIGLYTNVGMLPNELPGSFLTRSLIVDTVNPTLSSVGSFVDNTLRLDFY